MNKIILMVLMLSLTVNAYSQQRDKEDRKEAQEEKKSANQDRVDYTVFRRQILTLTEFSDQRRKLATMRNEGKGMGKIYAYVDSTNEQEDVKFLKGYIQLAMGDNSANVYEITYDRSLKRIILVKATGEQLEVEKAEPADKKAPVKTGAKAKPKKKTGDEDEDEEEEEEKEEKEKPVRGKQKDKDEEE